MIRIGHVITAHPRDVGSMAGYSAMVVEALEAVGQPVEVVQIPCYDPRGGSIWRHHLWRLANAGSVMRSASVDLYHLLDGSMAGCLPSAMRSRMAVTVHDAIPVLQSAGELAGRPSWPARRIIAASLRTWSRAAGLCADSTCTARDVQRWTGRDDVPVIPLAVSALPPSPAPAPGPRYLLHVGHNAWYKNRRGALDVFSRVKHGSGLTLIMVGPEPTPELRAEARRIGGVDFCVAPGADELRRLYAHAELLIFPSWYEGFGLPVVEAMAAGCPVVCSREGSLPEVAGSAALLAPAEDVDALAHHCRAVLNDEELRARLISAGLRHAESFSMKRLGLALTQWYTRLAEVVT